MGRHSRTFALAVGIALGIGSMRSTAGLAQFRSTAQMVPLTVTVTNRAGRYVPHLTAQDFTVFEDGKPQTLSYFAAMETPVDVAFLIDDSSSMNRDLSLAQEAACGLARRLKSGDRGAVAGLASNLFNILPMTEDFRRVENAIRSMRATGATALYESIYIQLRELERANRATAEPRRQVMVLLSDGLDNASHIQAEDVLDAVRRGDVAVYVILMDRVLRLEMDVGDSRHAFHAGFAMRGLARESGGRLFTPQSINELPATYQAIAEELRNQYLLAYVPSRQDGDGAFRRISVHVRHPEATQARTRPGYYAVPQRAANLAPRASRQ